MQIIHQVCQVVFGIRKGIIQSLCFIRIFTFIFVDFDLVKHFLEAEHVLVESLWVVPLYPGTRSGTPKSMALSSFSGAFHEWGIPKITTHNGKAFDHR